MLCNNRIHLTLITTLSFVLFFEITTPKAQNNYLPGMLYVKYQNKGQLKKTGGKSITETRARVRNFMQAYGLQTTSPLLSDAQKRKAKRLVENNGALRSKRNPTEFIDEIGRIDRIVIDKNYNTLALAAKLSRLPGVAYAEPHYVHTLQFEPNDPEIQTNLELMNFFKAWDISQGSKEVVIAIVDSGVDYKHDDLDSKLWVNQSEIPPTAKPDFDQNGDGIVESLEIKDRLVAINGNFNGDTLLNLEDALHPDSPLMDGIDNDENDFVDDLFGWDFWEDGLTSTTITADNNPVGSGSNHGTHVAGIATAEPNNEIAIAGTGFNSRYMAIKAGGIPDEPSTPVNESNQIGFGFDGMIYAALNGADVINASWGTGASSQVEQDLINAIADLGVVVVASAGNESQEAVSFPSGYKNVLSVGSVNHRVGVEKIKTDFSNFGFDVDVFATGNSITSTVFDNGTGILSGTSMSSPAVAGLAGLLKAEHPDWSAPQIMMQIRNSSEFIDNVNLGREDKMGHGLIDAERSLGDPIPGIRIDSVSFTNSSGEKLGIEEPGTLTVGIENVGISTSNLQVVAQAVTDGISIQDVVTSVGAVAQNSTTVFEINIEITSDFDINGPSPAIKLTFDENALDYEDRQVVEYEGLLFETVDRNGVKMSIGSNGTLGFLDPFNQAGGVGFVPRTVENGNFVDTRNQLFEGGVILQVGNQVASAVRGANGDLQRDFTPIEIIDLSTASSLSDMDSRTVYASQGSTPIRITAQSFSFADPDLSQAVFLRYDIENISRDLAENVRLGLFNDWDVGDFSANQINFSAEDSLLYVQDVSDGSQPFVAVAHMGGVAGALAIENGFTGEEDSLNFNIFDQGDMPGFTDQEKIWALKSDTNNTTSTIADVSTVVASGPYTLQPQNTITAGFIYAWGDNLEELRQVVENARALNLFSVDENGTVTDTEDEELVELPQKTVLHPNFPNPFNPSTQIQFDLGTASEVTFTVYNILGQKVATLLNTRMAAGTHQIQFNASQLSSGLYLGVLETGESTQTIKMNLIK